MIDALSHKNPDSNSYWDGNWVNFKIQIKIPRYTGDFSASLRIEEINKFSDKLQLMYKYLSGTVLRNIDEVIHF